MNLFPWLLFLHILGAVVAFGPTFAFPLIGGMGAREPMHGNFALRVSERIERGIVLPLAVVQGITGLGLVLTLGLDLTKEHWLDVAIVLYLTALGFAIFVQTKRIERMIHLTSAPPPAAPVPAAAPGAAMAAPPARPSGPPPEIAAAAAAIQQGGMFLTVLIVAIVSLMVLRPTF